MINTVMISGDIVRVHSQQIRSGYHRGYSITGDGITNFPVSAFNEVARDAKEDMFGFKWENGEQVPNPEPVIIAGKLKTHNGTYIELSDIKRGADKQNVIILTGIIGDIRHGDGTRFSLSWIEVYDKDIQNHTIPIYNKERVNIRDGEEVQIIGELRKGTEIYVEMREIG